MLYLFSNEFDISTHNIIYWLNFYNKRFIPVYLNQPILDFCLQISGTNQLLELNVSNCIYQIDLKNDIFFYRKGGFNYLGTHKTSSSQLSMFLTNELDTVKCFVEKLFYCTSNITTTNKLNKLEILKIAVDVGLNIPESIITTKKERLRKFYVENEKKIIAKPLYEGLNVNLNDGFLKTYTSRIEIEDIDNFERDFHPTLFQKEVDKMVDIRTFFLKGRFFSMAIFSQVDKMTEVDFRNYNRYQRLITTPFELPDFVKLKISKVFEILCLETGSIDLCLTKDGEFIFLEINPVGQYSMLYNCNYNLDREIAKIL